MNRENKPSNPFCVTSPLRSSPRESSMISFISEHAVIQVRPVEFISAEGETDRTKLVALTT